MAFTFAVVAAIASTLLCAAKAIVPVWVVPANLYVGLCAAVARRRGCLGLRIAFHKLAPLRHVWLGL